MAVTVGTFRTEIMLELGMSTADSDELSLALAWIQEGVDVVFNYADWADFMQTDESLPTVASQAEYSAQASAEKIVSIRLSANDSPLVFYQRQELEERGFDLEDTGEPWAFYPSGFDGSTDKYKFSLYPVPDAIYTMIIVERGQSAALTSSSTLPLPQQFRPALKDYIRARSYYNDGKVIEGQRADANFNSQLFLLRKKILQPANKARLAVTDIQSSGSPKWQRADPGHFNNRKW